MEKIEKIIAHHLLKIEAVKLSPDKPFTWASGWKSPIYCDNRTTLSYPVVREIIKNSFVELIKRKFTGIEVIAGVATGGIPQGVLVSQELNLPFVYVRSAAKGHGMGNLVEGKLTKGAKTVVVEDLISTGGSSVTAIEALRNEGADILGLVAIFTYSFTKASESFGAINCPFFTLSNYNSLLETALETNYITQAQLKSLEEWRINPAEWGK